MSQVTLMMVTYNRADYTKKTIKHLQEVTNFDFNLVIIDNGSIDDTVAYLKQLEMMVKRGRAGCIKNISIYLNLDNMGIGIGRTQGLLVANRDFPETKWYCTIDNDIIVPNNWLSNCISILSDIPKYGMIGVNFTGDDFPKVKLKGYNFQHLPKGNLGTACAVFGKPLHEKVGYFNTEYGLYGHEDADFGMRVRFAGYQLGYLEENGNCFDERNEDGDNEYVTFRRDHRRFKDNYFEKHKSLFVKNCYAYANGEKSLYIPASVEL